MSLWNWLFGGTSKAPDIDLKEVSYVRQMPVFDWSRVPRPALVWVWWQSCGPSRRSAKVLSTFAKENKWKIPVISVDGYDPTNRELLKKQGLETKVFPTVFLVMPDGETEAFDNEEYDLSIENLNVFVSDH